MATRLYLRNYSPFWPGTFPSTEQSSATASWSTSDASTLKVLSTDISTTAQASSSGTSLASTSVQYGYMGMFISPPLNGNQTVGGGTMIFNTADSEGNAATNFWVNGLNIYVWNPSNGTVRGVVRDAGSTSLGGTEGGTGETVNHITGITSSAVSALDGDVVVCEVWSTFTQGMATAYTNTLYYDGTTENTTENASVSNHASFIELTENLSFKVVSINGNATGNTGTGNIGTVSASMSINRSTTGNTGTGNIGSVTQSLSINKDITGSTGSVAVGSVEGLPSLPVIGNSVSGEIGNVTQSLSINKSITGNTGAGTIGNVTKTIDVGLTGNSVTAAIFFMNDSEKIDKVLSGVTTTGNIGSVVVTISKTLSGVTGVGNAGNPIRTWDITGNEATGTVGFINEDHVEVADGVSVTGTVGNVIGVSNSIAYVTGVSLEGTAGTVLWTDDPLNLNYNLQLLSPSAIIDLYQLHVSGWKAPTYYFHAGVNGLEGDVIWQGIQYTRYPIEAEGFEKTGKGTLPRPTIKASNITGALSELARIYKDLIGSKIIRKRTFVKYLDAVNFEGGNPTASPDVEFPDEIWIIDRKSAENPIYLEFELAASFDIAGVLIPRRQCIQNTCTWGYKSPECGYTGGPVAKANDAPTSNAAEDACGKKLTSCKLRWGNTAELPFGAFPAVGLIR